MLKSNELIILLCILLLVVLYLFRKTINSILNNESNTDNNNSNSNYEKNNLLNKNNNLNNNVKEGFDLNKVRNSSRVLYEYDNQDSDDFPGSIYEDSLIKEYNENPVLICNLIPTLTTSNCMINNIPIPKYKFPVQIMKMPNGTILSVFNDGRLYEKNNMNDKMWNGPIKNSLPFKKIPLRMITLNPNGTFLYGIGYDNRIYRKPENEQKTIVLEAEWELVEGLENVIFMMFKFEENKNYSRIIIINSEGKIKITNTDKFTSGVQDYGILTTPVLKLIYTSDNYMMAITNKFELKLFDDKVWESSDFSSKYGPNPNKVLDVMYDYDELLYGIVLVPKTNIVEIMKQEDAFPIEPFIPLELNRFKNSNINRRLNDKEIIKSKIGVIPSDNILEDDTLDNDINIAYQRQLVRDQEKLRKFCISKGLGRDVNYKNYDILRQIDSNNEKIEKLNEVIVNLVANDPNKAEIQQSIEGINFINQQTLNNNDTSNTNNVDNTDNINNN